MVDAPAQRIGRYEILAELGRGAMGIAYQARDPQLGRVVAIKTLRTDLGLPPEQDAELKRRFCQEATAAGRLNHPNIVTIHDVIELDGIPSIVMEYIEGRTLANLIAAEGPLGPARAVRLFTQVCGALGYAHARGVIHRDIKPGNILVTAAGVAKVSDFGIARIAGSSVTQTGALLGTPAYMAPEQLRGHGVDGRSDLFALGVSLYEALTGVSPFQADDITTVLYRVVHVDPVPIRERNLAVPPALDAVAARALAKQPEHRYPTAGAFAEALVQTLESAPTVVATPAPGGDARRPRRTPARARVARIAGGCLLVVGVSTWALSPWRSGLESTLEPAPAEVAGAARPPTAAVPRSPARRGSVAPIVGAIRVTTNPSVEVFLDGAFKGRADEVPLVIPDVVAGERLVVLRRGPREQTLQGVVRGGETLALSYHFPEAPRAASRSSTLQDALDKPRKALGKLRGALEKPRATLERLLEKPDTRGRPREPGGTFPEQR